MICTCVVGRQGANQTSSEGVILVKILCHHSAVGFVCRQSARDSHSAAIQVRTVPDFLVDFFHWADQEGIGNLRATQLLMIANLSDEAISIARQIADTEYSIFAYQKWGANNPLIQFASHRQKVLS